MRFLIDISMPANLGPWLAERGHDAVRVAEGLTPDQILASAATEKRTILTTNEILLDPDRLEGGVVFFQLPDPRDSELLERLEELLRRDPPTLGPGWAVMVMRGFDRIMPLASKGL